MAARGARGRTRARAAAATVSQSITAESCRKPFTPSLGFSITATAPASIARKAASVPRAARPEQMTTGIGSVAITRLQEGEPVHLWHLEVEDDHVGPRPLHLLEGDKRVGGHSTPSWRGRGRGSA